MKEPVHVQHYMGFVFVLKTTSMFLDLADIYALQPDDLL